MILTVTLNAALDVTYAVVASLGPDGLIAVAADGAWHAAVPAQAGNPTGAGDAVVAALAGGLAPAAGGVVWPALLADAAALSAAAVSAPVAGAVDLVTYRRLRDTVRLTPVSAS